MRDEGKPELPRKWQYRDYTERHMENHVGKSVSFKSNSTHARWIHTKF